MEIKNVQEYIDTIEKLRRKYSYKVNNFLGDTVKPHFLYRGHGNHKKYKLEPQIMRCKQTQYGFTTRFSQLEYNILSDFISEAKSYKKDIMDNDIQAWLEVAQHYDVPTRLMDLTENPLVALYFACRSESNTEASVWVINEDAYMKKFWGVPLLKMEIDSQMIVHDIVYREIILFGKQEQNKLPSYEYPWIYKPQYREERMKLQSSMFMIWGSKRCSLTDMVGNQDYMNLDDETQVFEASGIMCAITISSESKFEIIKQLDMLGVNEQFIYPGLEGIGKTIVKKYSAE